MKEDYYWNTFYTKDNGNNFPSPFAQEIVKRLSSEDVVIELGCGNGRDSLFLQEVTKKYYAVDYSEKAIKILQEKNSPSFQAIHCDINDIEKQNFDNPSVVYMRFFLHSIDEDTQARLLSWLSKKNDLSLFIECRSSLDQEKEKHFGSDHYRRAIDFEKLKQQLEAAGYAILHSEHARGLAKYKEEDPYIIRILAEKRKNV